MILALACSAFTLGFGQAPQSASVPEALAERELCTLLQSSATHFAAENLGQDTQLVLVGDPRFGALASLTLTPGQRVDYLLTDGAREGLYVEVLERDELRWQGTGAFPLMAIGAAAEDSTDLWIERGSDSLQAWAPQEAGHSQLKRPSASLASRPTSLVRNAGPAAVHVPGAPPTKKRTGDTPPQVPKKKLPPF